MIAAKILRTEPKIGKLSHVYKGTTFEKRTQSLLQIHFSMSLRRVGGKSDGGVDLVGWWWLPLPSKEALAVSFKTRQTEAHVQRSRIRVFAQCKAEKKKATPRYVREMEGVLGQYASKPASFSDSDPNADWDRETDGDRTLETLHQNGHPCVALLASESPFSKSTLLRVQSSSIPFFLLHIPPVLNELPGNVGAVFWNSALGGTKGLLGGQIEARWERDESGGGRPGLWIDKTKIENWVPSP